jgi:uncharacterized protein (TIGR00290 family)
MAESLKMQKALLSWSGGKDCALALERLAETRETQIVGLLTTVARDEAGIYRVPIHGVRRELIERQADALALPVHFIEIPANASNIEYESRLAEALAKHRRADLHTIAFGDLFLADIRAYRETFFARIGWQCLFPLWHENTTRLCSDFIARGFKAVIASVDANRLDPSFAGRFFDKELLADFSAQAEMIDPCGERGEFHTFVFDAPYFSHPAQFSKGAVQLQNNHYICDLMPV